MPYTPQGNLAANIATHGYRITGQFYFEISINVGEGNLPAELIVGVATSNYGIQNGSTRIGEESDSFITYKKDSAYTFGMNLDITEVVAINTFINFGPSSSTVIQTFTDDPLTYIEGDRLGIHAGFIVPDGITGVNGGTVILSLNGVDVASVTIQDPASTGYPDFRPAVAATTGEYTITGHFTAASQLYRPSGAQAWDPT